MTPATLYECLELLREFEAQQGPLAQRAAICVAKLQSELDDVERFRLHCESLRLADAKQDQDTTFLLPEFDD